MVRKSQKWQVDQDNRLASCSPQAHNVRIPLKINLKILNCLISALFITAISVPNLAVAEYKLSYTVKGNCNNYINQIEQYDWPVALTVQVFEKESNCNPDAHNPEAHKDYKTGKVICYGSENVPQIGCVHYKKGEDKRDPELAISKAYEIYSKDNRSFRQWGVCKKIKNCI